MRREESGGGSSPCSRHRLPTKREGPGDVGRAVTLSPSKMVGADACDRRPQDIAPPAKRPRTNEALCIADMPFDVLRNIFRISIENHSTISVVRSVCCEWRGVMSDDFFWESLTLIAWGSRPDIIDNLPPPRKTEFRMWYQHRVRQHQPAVTMKQPNVTVTVRSILLGWMLAVVDEFRDDLFFSGMIFNGAQLASHDYWRQRTQNFATSFLDRFLERACPLEKSNLQLVGAACIVLAMRHETVLDDIPQGLYAWVAQWADGAFSSDTLQRATATVFTKLTEDGKPLFLLSDSGAFDISYCALLFMGKVDECSLTNQVTVFLRELALQSEVALMHSSKVLGAACFVAACHTLGWELHIWLPCLEKVCSVEDYSLVRECSDKLLRLFRHANRRVLATHKSMEMPHTLLKFCGRDRMRAATIIAPKTPVDFWWKE